MLGIIMFKDNLRAFPGRITSEDNLQVCLYISNLWSSPGFMLRKPVSPTMLELPLSRDLDLDHYSSLHHTQMQVKSTKSNSSFQKKHTTSQIVSGNIFFLSFTQHHAGLHPAKPRDHTWSHTKVSPRSALPINGTAFPIRIHIIFWFASYLIQ